MIHRISKISAAVIAAVCIGSVNVSFALPSLQLDISNGVYDNATETIVATKDKFTLYAYLIPDANAKLDDFYYISAAVTPKYGPTGGSLGSFAFDGKTIGVTGDMVYGNPPIDSSLAGQDYDPGDLASHSIFDTYFAQFKFQFDPLQTRSAYNVQDGSAGNGDMYYQTFDIDVTGLSDGYGIHFDLYNTVSLDVMETVKHTYQSCTTDKRGKTTCVNKWKWIETPAGQDMDINSFAPFSHDAESGETRHHEVPEPSTLLLLGGGLIGFATATRKKK